MNKSIYPLLMIITSILSIKAIAAKQCELDGMERFHLSCANKQENLKLTMEGTSGEELSDNIISFKNYQYKSNPEVEVPGFSFERVDVGVFTAIINNPQKKIYLRLMGIPSTFKVQGTKLGHDSGFAEGSGTFTGILKGFFNLDDDKTKVESTISCTFDFIDCSRKEMAPASSPKK